MTTQLIRLDQIVLRVDAWPRRALDEARVGEFLQLYVEGGLSALPPVEVVAIEDGTFVIADGWHRLTAIDQTNVKEMPCVVLLPPPGDDPALFAFMRALETSATAAKPLTLGEKRAAADRLITDMPEASDSEIGRLTGLSHQTIGRRRRRHLSNGQIDTEALEPADKYQAVVSARAIADKLVGSIDRLWEARGLSDFVMGDRSGKHLAQALVDRFGDDAPGWARRFEQWATTAIAELDRNPP